MTASGGFYLMHRGWMDHPELATNEPFSRREAWCWLIENATFSGHRQRIGSVIVDLQRGQLAASTRYLGRAWGWDEKKVRRFLVRLKTASMIAAETAAGVTVVTICNYSTYQSEGEKGAAPSAAETAAEAPQHRRKIEQGNNVKKESIDHREGETLFEIDEQAPAEQGRFEQWWAMVPKKVGKGQARKAFTAALRKAPIERLKDGIARYAQSVADADPKYIKHPSTWLSGECWLDDLPAVEQPAEERDEEAEAAFTREYEAIKRRYGAASVEMAAFVAKQRPANQTSEARR